MTKDSFSETEHEVFQGLSIRGKTALVTGSSRGIGACIAIKLAKAGAAVVINYDKSESYKDALEVQNLIRSTGCEADIIQANISVGSEVRSMMEQINDKFHRLDVLVNNAGIILDHTIEKMSEDEWSGVLNVNLTSIWLCSKYAIEYFMRNQESGKIINVSSVVGLVGNFGQTNYAASKAGIIGLSRSLAKEASRYNVYVNVVVPGFMNTRMCQKIPSERRAKIIERILLKRIGEPEEVANLVLFLASSMSSYIDGAVIVIDGGYTL
jgi:3-oxoacyl-[acyl-carrier protein] reductase